jgi:hypothetical protein
MSQKRAMYWYFNFGKTSLNIYRLPFNTNCNYFFTKIHTLVVAVPTEVDALAVGACR